MNYSAQQIQQAIARAQQAGDSAAVADLQERLRSAQAAPVGAGPGQPVQSASEGAQGRPRAGQGGPGWVARATDALFGGGATQQGIADSAIKAGLGVKSFFGGLSDEDKAVLAEMEADKAQETDKFKRGAGEVIGNIAMTALPGGAAAKGIQSLKMLGRAAPLAAAAGSGAVTEFVTRPGDLAEKAKGAGEAALWSGGLAAGAKTLAKPFTGMFRAAPEAESLMRQGINPTLQQGAATQFGKWVGGLTSGSVNVRDRLRDEGANAILRRATEGNRSLPSGTGQEFAESARSYMDDAYNQLWQGKMINISPATRKAVMARVSQVPRDNRGAREASEAAALMANRLGDSASNQRFTAENFRKEFRNPISEDTFNAQGQVRERMMAGRELLDKLATNQPLTRQEQGRLRELNRLNFDAKRLEEATAGRELAKEGVDFRRLSEAYAKRLPQAKAVGNTTYEETVAPMARLMASTPNQDMARSTIVALRRMVAPAIAAGAVGTAAGVGPAATLLAVPYGVSLLGQTGRGSKALLGQYDSQKKLAELLRNYVGPAAGVTGAAIEE